MKILGIEISYDDIFIVILENSKVVVLEIIS